MVIEHSSISIISQCSNEEIINTYLNYYRHSPQSIKTRKTSLNYFFSRKYFGYPGQVFDINKRDLFEYFNYLNNLETISIKTKQNKWVILKSFLEFCMEYYDNFIVIIPKKTIQWKTVHKKPISNVGVIAEKSELEAILKYLKENKRYNSEHYYLLFKILIETGMRVGEVVNIDYDTINLPKRYIETVGKTGRKIYYISKELAIELKNYIDDRRKVNLHTKALFTPNFKSRYTPRAIQYYIKKLLGKLNIKTQITPHTFRRALNTYRKLMNCPAEDRKILLNHKTGDINLECYVSLNYSQFLALYDKWNPYKELTL